MVKLPSVRSPISDSTETLIRASAIVSGGGGAASKERGHHGRLGSDGDNETCIHDDGLSAAVGGPRIMTQPDQSDTARLIGCASLPKDGRPPPRRPPLLAYRKGEHRVQAVRSAVVRNSVSIRVHSQITRTTRIDLTLAGTGPDCPVAGVIDTRALIAFLNGAEGGALTTPRFINRDWKGERDVFQLYLATIIGASIDDTAGAPVSAQFYSSTATAGAGCRSRRRWRRSRPRSPSRRTARSSRRPCSTSAASTTRGSWATGSASTPRRRTCAPVTLPDYSVLRPRQSCVGRRRGRSFPR